MNQRAASESPYYNSAKIYLKGMAVLLQGLFEAVDNALFQMAEKAESNSLQSHYFDGMRQVRKNRSAVENTLLKSLRASVIRFQKGIESETPESAPLTEESLSLVDEADLERNLAISEMVAKGQNRLSRQLFALSQRLGESTGKTPPDDETNPMGPAVICAGLQEAGERFEVELPVLLVIYKLFDRVVLEKLDGLYGQINQCLINDGMMPTLQHRAVTSAGQRGAASAPAPSLSGEDGSTTDGVTGSAEQPPDGDPGGYSDGPMTDDQGEAANAEILQSILSLLSARHRPAADAQPTTQAPHPHNPDPGRPVTNAASQTQHLLNALSLLQNAAPIDHASGEGVKHQVMSEMGKLDDSATASSDEETTIDLVAMLFEFILNDKNLPQPMQVMLARLQIPYIKVALIDRQLFGSHRHPARRLLDTLADMALGWSAETDRGNRLHNHMESVVNRIIQDFDDDLSLFDELRQELNDYVSRFRKRAHVAEKRTTEAAEGKQRLHQARRMASDIISEHLDGQELPSIVTEILSKPWANVLVLTCLRQGKESEAFTDAVAFVHQLIWSIEPKTEASEVARLQAELPSLTARLRAGLDLVGYHRDDIQRVFTQLKTLYRSMLDSQYRNQLKVPSSTPPSTMSLPAAVAPVQLPISGAADLTAGVFDDLDNEPEPVAQEQLEQVLREQIESLSVGTWFQFTGEQGVTQRAKLSWKSPITGKYLFVDHKGIKIADIPVEELALALANGEVVALEAVPLFDRALTAIAERLQNSAEESGQAIDRATDQATDQANDPANTENRVP